MPPLIIYLLVRLWITFPKPETELEMAETKELRSQCGVFELYRFAIAVLWLYNYMDENISDYFTCYLALFGLRRGSIAAAFLFFLVDNEDASCETSHDELFAAGGWASLTFALSSRRSLMMRVSADNPMLRPPAVLISSSSCRTSAGDVSRCKDCWSIHSGISRNRCHALRA